MTGFLSVGSQPGVNGMWHAACGIWRENNIRRSQVENRMASIRPGSKSLHDFATSLIEDAVRRGFLAE